MIRDICSVAYKSNYLKKASRFAEEKINKLNTNRRMKRSLVYTLSVLASYGIFSNCTAHKEQNTALPAQNTEQVHIPYNTSLEVQESKLAPNGYYTVKEGDTVWDIAKSLLEESGLKDISDPQIYRKSLKIMKLNNLKFPSDTCERVVIHAGDVLYVEKSVNVREKVKNADFSKYTDDIANTLYRICTH